MALTVLSQADILFRGETASPTAFDANLSFHVPPSSDPILDPTPGIIQQSLGHLGVQLLRHGQSPWWNPYVGLGSPLAQDFQSAVFYPPVLLANWFHLQSTGIDVVALGDILIAGLSAYWLARVLGLRVRGSLVVGTAFCLSGSFIWFGTLFGNVVAWTPASLALTLRLAQGTRLRAPPDESAKLHGGPAAEGAPASEIARGSRWDVLLLGLVTAIQILGGFPEALGLQILLLNIPLLVGRLVSLRDRRRVLVVLGRIGAGFGLGILATAFLWVPFLADLRAEGVWNPAGSGLGQRLPIWSDLTLMIPFVFGHWFSRKFLTIRQWYHVGGYLGVVATWLGLAGVFGCWRRRTWLVATLVVSVVVAVSWMNGLPPFIWINHLPVLNRIGLGRLAVAPLQLDVALLAGLAVDRWVGWKASTAATVTCAAALLALAQRAGGNLNPLPVDFAVLCFVLIAVGFPLVAAASRRWRSSPGQLSLRRAGAGGLVLALLAVELLTLSNADWRGLPSRGNVWAAPTWIRYVQHHLGGGRLYAADALLAPNYSSDFGIADISFEDAVVPRATERFIRREIDPSDADALVFEGVPMAATIPGRVPDLELAGVTLLALPDPGCKPACNDLSRRFVDRSGDVAVFSVPDPQPFLWFPRRVAEGDRVPSDLFQDVSVNPLPRSLVGQGSLERASQRMVSLDNSQLVARVQVGVRRLLVVRELEFPGWHATVNGRPAPIDTVDGVFQGIVVPRGTSTVRVFYIPPDLHTAEAASLLAVVCAAALALSGAFRHASRRFVPSTQ